MSSRLSPAETMLSTSVGQYFEIGAEAVEFIEACLRETGRPPPSSILDFPCGHGRVLRMIAARWPDASLSAGDTDRAGVDFCVAEFGATGVYSRRDLGQVDAGGPFDLAFCGSLLTHFGEDGWVATLAFFRRHLAPGGVLVFTAHGDFSAQVMAGKAAVPSLAPRYGFTTASAERIMTEFQRAGFAFSVYDGDPPDSIYGHSVSARAWVEARIREADLRLEHVIEGGWGLHQDVYACSPRA